MMTSTPISPRRRLLPTGLALAVAVSLAAAAGHFYLQAPAQAAAQATAAAPPAMPVTVANVLERRITEWDEFSGRLEAIERVEVRSRVSGHIESVNFAPGSMVAKGATLFVIDAKPFAAELSRADAAVAAAHGQLVFADSELARSSNLLVDHAISQREFEQRQNAQRDAMAALKSAQASVELARLNLGYTRVTAPISGRVGRAEITAGNLVAAGAGAAVLTSIVSTSPIHATFEADEQTYLKYSARVEPGSKDKLTIRMGLANEQDHPREGRIEFVDNTLDAQTGTIRMRAVFDNRDGRLAPGLFARLQLASGSGAPAILIDDRAVSTDQSKKFVYLVDAQRRVVYREVKLGPLVDGLRVVRSGLRAGETIVVNGVQRVRPGIEVAPTATPMDARANATERMALALPGKSGS